MTSHGTASLTGGVALLERAIGYTRDSLRLVTDAALVRPTPCHSWDLRGLLDHMNDSLAALQQAADPGYVDVGAAGTGPLCPSDRTVQEYGLTDTTSEVDPSAALLVAALKDRACRLLGAWAALEGPRVVSVGGAPLTGSVVAGSGALEIAVHGWDIVRACGGARQFPPALAQDLLELAPLFVTGEDRPERFAPPVSVPAEAGPRDRLIAFLGRDPYASNPG